MKSASIPSLRVDPELREAAESRKAQHEFIARGLRARDEAKRSGDYIPAEEVLRELDRMLAKAERKRRVRR